jgi:hypothetical protein
MNFVESGFVDNGYFIRDSDTAGNFRFDGFGRKVFVNAGVTSITMVDLYSQWCNWLVREDNAKFAAAIRVSGYDPIPGGFTGATFFLYNGWKLVYDPASVAVAGVLYSDDYDTAYWTSSGAPVYPATVSSLVNSAVSYQNVVTGTALTAEQTAAAVWGAAVRTLTASLDPSAAQMVAALLAAAQADPIHADARRMNGAEVVGTGQVGDTWRGAGVPA